MIVLALIALPFALLVGFVQGSRLVFRGVRTRVWTAPGTWGGIGLLAASGAALTFVYGMFAGFGGMDRGETCGEAFDSKFVGEHNGDPLFPLHSWCNATHDLVPSWVNPTIVSLAGLSTIGLGLSAVTGAARTTRALSARRARTEEEKQREKTV